MIQEAGVRKKRQWNHRGFYEEEERTKVKGRRLENAGREKRRNGI